LRKLITGSLFTGSGMGVAAVNKVFNAQTAWVADNDPGSRLLLEYHYPHTPNLGDVSEVDWSEVEPVDIIHGGTPCQDVSVAGARIGMTEGSRSNLWVVMREAIRIVQPVFVVWENVTGALSAHADSLLDGRAGRLAKGNLSAVGRVLGDLAELGFDAEWRVVRASDAGALHKRSRIFILSWHPDRVPQTGDWASRLQESHPILGAQDAGCARAGDGGPEDMAPAFERWSRQIGYQWPAVPNVRRRLSTEFGEWFMGWPQGWVSEVPGLSATEGLKIIGNGVVPQQEELALHIMIDDIIKERSDTQ